MPLDKWGGGVMYEMRKSGVGGVMQRFFVLLGILAVSAAASHVAPAPAPHRPAAAKPAAPTDGQPRVIERRGKFIIKPDTLFCSQEGKIHPSLKATGPFYGSVDGVQLRAALKAIGQSDLIGGSKRAVMLSAMHCPDNGENIVFEGLKTLNATAAPYRLELSARQGPSTRTASAFVKVVVERADGMSPDYSPFVFDGGADAAFLLRGSIMTDGKIISKILVEQLFSSRN